MRHLKQGRKLGRTSAHRKALLRNLATALLEHERIITTEPNKLVEKVHNRMPVILPKEKEKVWLESDMMADALISLLKPYPAEQMKMYEISMRVNRTAEGVPEIIKPVQ